MKIKLMPKHMAELIAAGEVVERPASVIKELAENSIDAGATSLTIEIKGGGSSYMRVSDNGSGISAEDLPLAFKTHATSKISTEKDLESISTLGFRGEALASICAVSKVEVLTLAEGEELGSAYKIYGGEEISLENAGCPKGTTVVVRDLFYNTPARMKFLKKDITEGNYVGAVVDRIALSHPEVAIKFIREGKQIFATNGDGKLYNAVFAVFGSEFAKSLIEVDYELGGIKVHGFISKPLNCRANRSMQYFFISGRQVKSVTAMSALENAYKNSVMVGKVPACVLHIDMPFEAVDVNVHPAKTEVRFANEKAVFDAVYYACKNALAEKDTPKFVNLEKKDKSVFARKEPTPVQEKFDIKTFKSEPKEEFWSNLKSGEFKKINEEAPAGVNQSAAASFGDYAPKKRVDINIEFDEPEKEETPAENSEALTRAPEKARDIKTEIKEEIPFTDKEPEQEPEQEQLPFRIVGEIFKTYIVVEQGNEVLFIDKHAAHERMIYETLKKQDHSQAQLLIEPVTVTLSKEDYDAVLSNTNELENSGFLVEDFGMGTVLVRGFPMVLEKSDIEEVLEETAGYLKVHKRDFNTDTLDWLYHNVSCRAAIKAGNNTSPFEMEGFVKKLLSMPDIRYCPHGRPVMIIMSKYEFEKQFGRVN